MSEHKIMQGFRRFKEAIRLEGLSVTPGPFAALVHRAYCAGWKRGADDTTELRPGDSLPVDNPPHLGPMTLEEAHAAWDQRRDFSQYNRRQTSKIGFFAGWHSRKLAEFKWALVGRPNSSFSRAWKEGAAREERNMEATRAALEGRNWFTDSTGRTWVDAPSELAAQWAAGELDLVDPVQEFLRRRLQGKRPNPVHGIFADAADLGWGPIRVTQAASALGIVSERVGGEFFWRWPEFENDFETGLDAGIPIG